MTKWLLTTILVLSLSPMVFAAHSGGTARAYVNGLVCDFCARAIEKVFGKQESVESVRVDLDEKVITIHFNQGQKLDDGTITRLIADSGYNVQEIRRDE